MKICPVEAELFHKAGEADGWIDRMTDTHDEANRCFSKFYEHIKNDKHIHRVAWIKM
jgi:hypothetical protein